MHQTEGTTDSRKEQTERARCAGERGRTESNPQRVHGFNQGAVSPDPFPRSRTRTFSGRFRRRGVSESVYHVLAKAWVHETSPRRETEDCFKLTWTRSSASLSFKHQTDKRLARILMIVYVWTPLRLTVNVHLCCIMLGFPWPPLARGSGSDRYTQSLQSQNAF